MVEPATVEEFVDGLDGPQKEIVEKIRAIVKRTLPQAVETMKWRQPVYVYDGKNIITIMVFEDHINYGLFMGARMKSERLEGTGKGLRHVKVYETKDVDEKEFARLAGDAAELA
ncbi:MAG: DUF1801 domain-containing protein [Thaumarchaeota archaeon]|nr:DUF1801 domain-containing protein [Nitrososphaerota archaeon]